MSYYFPNQAKIVSFLWKKDFEFHRSVLSWDIVTFWMQSKKILTFKAALLTGYVRSHVVSYKRDSRISSNFFRMRFLVLRHPSYSTFYQQVLYVFKTLKCLLLDLRAATWEDFYDVLGCSTATQNSVFGITTWHHINSHLLGLPQTSHFR